MILQKAKFKLLGNNQKLFFDFSYLVSGTVIAQIIPLLLQPLLRRLFSPEVFGIFAIYTSIFGIISIIASFRYEQAILLPKKDSEAKAIAVLAFVIAFMLSFSFFWVVLLMYKRIPDLLNIPKNFVPLFLFLPFSSFFFASYQIINSLLLRSEFFKETSISRISRRGVEAISQYSLGRMGISGGLIIGDVLGNIAFFLTGLLFLIKLKINPLLIKRGQVKQVAYKYVHFPKHNLIPHLLSTFSLYLPFFFLNRYFESSQVGQFDLARLVLTVPSALISTALSQLVFQRVTQSRNKGIGFYKDLRFIFLLLCCVAFAVILIILPFAPFLFGYIFGDNWVSAGKIAQIIVVGSMVRFVIAPFSIMLLALEKIKINSIWQIAHFIFLFVVLLTKMENLTNYLIAYVLVEFVSYIAYFFILLYHSKRYHLKLGNLI